MRRVRSYGLQILRYLFLPLLHIFGVIPCRYGIAWYSTIVVQYTGEDASRCSWRIRRLVGRIRRCVDKLGGWEEKVQRTAKHYDDDGHRQDVGLRLLRFGCCCYYGESTPPRNASNRRRRADSRGTGQKQSQLWVE